jgi:hypothetical protein
MAKRYLKSARVVGEHTSHLRFCYEVSIFFMRPHLCRWAVRRRHYHFKTVIDIFYSA